MQKEVIIPITWESWDKQDELCNSYYDVTFTDDFGIFEKDEFLKSVTVDYANGFIETYNEDGSIVLKTQNFIAKPI